jgi:hypothetical protein
MTRQSALLAISVHICGCAGDGSPPAENSANNAAATLVESNPLRDAYFGDLHVHTAWSFDSFAFNVRTTPDDAYRFAKGEAIDHVGGGTVQLAHGPLDFLAVTDHAEYMGLQLGLADPESAIARHPEAGTLLSEDRQDSRRAMRMLAGWGDEEISLDEFSDPDHLRSTWQEVVAAAERHYEPGRFTSLVGFEWTSAVNLANLHRNVVFRGTDVPELPFSSQESRRPEDLWAYMESARSNGSDVLAIPHNANKSDGLMFQMVDSDGNPIDGAYATRRMANEPVVEAIQIKGQSEAHPALSPNDEFADFEVREGMIGAPRRLSQPAGSYARQALKDGLLMEERGGFNPYRFGMVGSTDGHNSTSPTEEDNFSGKLGIIGNTAEVRLQGWAKGLATGYGAAGIAGVWAESNTRESIFDALRRKETFATSGPHIKVRFFGGWDFGETDAAGREMVRTGYDRGVPMGGDLTPPNDGDGPPTFMVSAIRDPENAPLQRLQIIKGWVEGGDTKETVYDVACSDGGAIDPTTHRCPDNGAVVDLDDCTISEDVGSAQLTASWVDPDFDAVERAFYYVRVIENPTCRWSTWDALRLGIERPESVAATIQERAITSPIWYVAESR